MDFGSMMSNLAIGAGQSMISGAEQQQRQASADDTRAQAQMRQMSAMTMKQDLADRKSVSDETQAAQATFQQSQKTASDVQKLATAKEGAALSHNQFGMAKEYADMARMAEAEQKTALQNKAEEVHQLNEGVAQAASAYSDVPSTENAKALAEQATRAGQKNIPPTGTPEFASWATGQKMAAMDSGKKLEWVQKEADVKARQTETERHNKETEAARLDGIRSAAQGREMLEAGRQERAALARVEKEKLQFEREKFAAGQAEKKASGGAGKLSAPEKLIATHVAGGMSFLGGELENLDAFKASDTSGVFAGLTGSTAPEKLVATGAQAITPAVSQMLHSSYLNMGRAVIGMEVATLGGRYPSAPQLDKYQADLEAGVGKDPLASAYVLSLVAKQARNAYEGAPKFADNDPRQLRADKVYDQLKKYPEPSVLLQAARKDPSTYRKLEKAGATVEELRMRAISDYGSTPAASAASNDGWTIKAK